MSYSKKELNELEDFFSNQLLNDKIPIWIPLSLDNEHGSFLFMRDANATLIDNANAV